MKRLVTFLVVGLGLATGPGFLQAAGKPAAPAELQVSGTLQPEDTVDVTPTVPGTVLRFGAEGNGKTVDYSSRVKRGEVLAQLDPRAFEVERDQAEAAVRRAEASLRLARAQVTPAEIEFQRMKKLGTDKLISAQEFNLVRAKFDVARAAVEVEEAAVLQAKAALRRAHLHLDGTRICSPVDGVIIDRRVNLGQAVKPDPGSPSLFVIATDLKRLQVWASVPEADIVRVRRGQPVTFTVPAYPKDTFKGRVTQVRLNATLAKEGVFYTVVIETDNSAGRLLPYMTAHVRIPAARAGD
jgi:HlyD family secretion protein